MSNWFSPKGWRRTAIINVVLASVCDLILLIILIISLSQPGASLVHPSIVFYGSCTTSSRLNLLLHFLINIISTAVLASSNFFMQILNAPSRQEIDRAHTWLQSLDIGIPSVRNLSHVSKLKSASWLIFLVTSIPIHLIFNSSVFETTYDGAEWYLTLATEAFTQEASFFPPGASLSPAGSFSPFSSSRQGTPGAYGENIPLDQYWNVSSFVRRKIASVAEESHSWTFLSAEKCYLEYVSCNPRNDYGDVVMILDSATSQGGWARSDVFTFDPSSNLSMRWDKYVPPNVINSLWFSAECRTTREKSPTGKTDHCTNTCLGALGLDEYRFLLSKDTLPTAHEPWPIDFFPAVRDHNNLLFDEGLEFNHKFDSLRVNHCLAQPIQPSCKVGLSNALLLIVILSILVKTVQSSIIAWTLSSASLVTPGDAVESFILYPDAATQGLGTLDIVDAHNIESGRRRRWSDDLHLGFTTKPRSRRWKKSFRRIRQVIPYTAWVKTYSILFAGLALLLTGLISSSETTMNNYSEFLDHSKGVLSVNIWGDQPPSYIATLLFTNTPQLILSLCYFSYNSLLTQFHVEKEWNAFSISHKPLRVSYPAGQQCSSYRFQLPYTYSIPLIFISITLHWLLSNALFLYVNEGGYWDPSNSLTGFYDAYSVSDGSTIAIGYNPSFLLALFIAGVVIITVPPLLAFSKMKGDMVAGSWNSLVISAACHVPDNTDRNQDEQFPVNESDMILGEYTRAHHAAVSNTAEEDEARFNSLLDLSQRKLRWGDVQVPGGLSEFISSDGEAVSHLGFGGEEHEVSEPKEGQYYI
ncbi:hypothetical protein F5Y07DRAFT_362955 [Xylaria sp. FL0933]|nr:hypothetical protein F5Y07DRAFT_362955 [Xylaria sp. FL0933]